MIDRSAAHGSTPTRSIPKTPTGIVGLDDVLDGGLPTGRTTLISGGPGSGKTILALQHTLHRVMAGEASIFVSCEERLTMLRENAASMGYDVALLERTGRLVLIEAKLSTDMVFAGDFNVKGLLAVLEGLIGSMGAKNLAIDGIDVLLRVFDDPRRERNELHLIHDTLHRQGITAILTAKMLPRTGAVHQEWLEFMADCVLLLDHRVIEQVSTRRLRVLKFRGSGSGRNEYPYVLGSKGMRIVPVSSAHLQFAAPGTIASTGIHGLDGILGGGIRQGTSLMISGASSTGKTTLASMLVSSAARRGERTLYVNFEGSAEALISHMRSPGIDLGSAVQAQQLRILSILPEARGVEEHLIDVLDHMDQFQPGYLVVDAVSATKRRGSTLAAFDHAMRLLSACRDRKMTCIFTDQGQARDEVSWVADHGLSSLVDTTIALRFVRVEDRLERCISVVKSRGQAHSFRFHPFVITDRGVRIDDPSAKPPPAARASSRNEKTNRA